MIRDMASVGITQDSPKVGLGLVVISFKTTYAFIVCHNIFILWSVP